MKKMVSVLLALTLTAGIAGCAAPPAENSSQKLPIGSSTAESTADSGVSAGEAATATSYFKKYDPPITITVNGVSTSPSDIYPEGEDATNNNYTRWAENNLGIKFVPKWIAANGDIEKQKLGMAMASNDLPDFIVAPQETAAKIMKSGLVTEIDSLMEEYASPLTKYLMEDFDTALNGKAFTVAAYNGKRYGIADWADPWAVDCQAIWLRKDILDKAGMEIPETVEEFEKYLEAAKQLDPNYVGLVMDKDLQGIQMAAMDPFGAAPNIWLEKEGQLVYGGVQPEVKKGLELLSGWYTKGYLDKEFVAKDWNKSLEAFSSAKALAVEGKWWMYGWPLTETLKTEPGSSFTSLPMLKGPDGRVQMALKPGIGGNARMINKNFSTPEAAIYQLNEHVDSSFRDNTMLIDLMKNEYDYSFKYPKTENMGEIIGGYPKPDNYDEIKDADGNYDPTKGKWSYTAEGPRFTYNTMTNSTQLGMRGFFIIERAYQLKIGMKNAGDAYRNGTYEALSMEDKNYYATIESNSNNVATQIEAFYHLRDDFDTVIDSGAIVYDKFLGSPTATQVEKGAYLTKLKNETFAKIIMGEQPIDSFDTFVNEWHKAGGEKWSEEVNQWYFENK